MKLLFAGLIVFLSGCSSYKGLIPNTGSIAVVHQSQPMHGPLFPPVGDYGNSEESRFNGVELGVQWDNDKWFAETSMTYAITNTNIAGGPWIFTAKTGVKLPLSSPK